MANRSDDFNRADAATPIGTPSDGGSAWVAAANTWGISGNRAYTSAGSSESDVTLDSGTSAVEVQVTISTLSADAGLCFRLADVNNMLLAQLLVGTGIRMFKRVGGTYTQLGSTYSGSIASGDVLKVRADSSNNLTAYQNGVSRVTANDSAGASNTRHGLRTFNDTASRFDDFSITDIVAAPVSQKLIFFSRQAVNRAATY